MKQIITFTLTVILVISLVAGCGSVKQPETTEPAATPAPEIVVPASALTVLESVWSSYAEGEKFPIMGGNMENAIMDAPGEYDLTYAENLTYNLLVPEDQIANVDQVASMIHAMNANTFTCGAFHLKQGVAAADFASAMHTAISGNQWMCGFPERMIIAELAGDYVVVAFGMGDAMTPFATHLAERYPEAQVLYDEPIA